MSFVASPTPANGLRHAINRHSMDVDVGDSTRPSLEIDVGSSEGGRPSIDSDAPGTRPSMNSEGSRPSFDSVRPLSPAQRLVQQKQNQLVKQSTASSMLSLSSVNSSPCPRPPRRKLLMLTGGRLPRAPVAAPIFKAAAPAVQVPSPAPGRVRKLKDSWEAKLSPKKEDTVRCECIRAAACTTVRSSQLPSATGSSPRYVRPLPPTLGQKSEVQRPRLLTNLSLNGSYSELHLLPVPHKLY